jgi:hypothetical protein
MKTTATNILHINSITMRIRIAFTMLAVICAINFASAQQALPTKHVNPWTAKPLGTLPPIASLTDGVWLKGDLHVHSSHSTEGGYDPKRQPVKTIIAFAQSVGFGFIGITDHDNHVLGDVEHNTWADPDFKSDSVLLLYGAEWTTTRGHGNTFLPNLTIIKNFMMFVISAMLDDHRGEKRTWYPCVCQSPSRS